MNSAIIVAGGRGSRLGLDRPKQFLKLNGKEILSYSVDTFTNHPNIHEVIIVCHKDWIEHTKKYYPKCIVVNGGKRRQDSSLKGVLATNIASKNVLIHDAARPFITAKLIDECISAIKSFDASAPILDSNSSLIELKDGKILSVKRDNIKSVQTPQCFNRNLILDVLNSSLKGTDEIGKLLQFDSNKRIKLVQGHANNFKITMKLDLILASSILKELS
ncbi:MAG: 2-C-methyl-D-erythritol 4-phosphate cytidylyltransferase [Candidatus Marinimicrobia bacterium]|nr:2-C-methyl-D-erythritol 4-phosphate cytidylyltransferase [Candidatus Neomarinimicrobiota bacterium]